ncbi:MAG TPA: hypothetical protein QGF58_01930 [Myxococcota bacterium]|nr:hypothetical protein [Myxococcota bacterium]
MLLISLFACTQTETPTDNATEPTPAKDEIVEFGPGTGSFSAETASTEALVALGSTMADMMEDEGVRRFFEDGGVPPRRASSERGALRHRQLRQRRHRARLRRLRGRRRSAHALVGRRGHGHGHVVRGLPGRGPGTLRHPRDPAV